MEVDGAGNDSAKFLHMKNFINAAREFNASHSEVSVNLMSRYLGLIAASCDLSMFTPGRSEVCAFFSNLWQVMNHPRGPHWAGVAVLSRAAQDQHSRHALTHTYRFMPILTRLLSDSLCLEKKIRLLSLMQDVSYGIKISWQESYLTNLLKQLTDWVMTPASDPQNKPIGQKSLTVLVNVCYGNLPAIYTLMRTVDTRNFIVHLVNMKERNYGSVQVCRLLLCLQGGRAARGGALPESHVHSYVACAVSILPQCIRDKDAVQLLHANSLLSDICCDSHLKSHVMSYPHYEEPLKEAIKNSLDLCNAAGSDSAELDNSAECIQNILKLTNQLVNLDLFVLRSFHPSIVELCVRSSRLCGCLGPALELFAALVSQYKDERSLPVELLSCISHSLTGMLVPPSLEPGKAGLQWLQLLSALCSCPEMQESLLKNVSPEAFEDTLYMLLQHTAQNGTVGYYNSHDAVIYSCSVCLTLAHCSEEWNSALSRLLANHQVCKVMSSCLAGSNTAKRKQVLQIIKHPHFPTDKINQVFGTNDNLASAQNGDMTSLGTKNSSQIMSVNYEAPGEEKNVTGSWTAGSAPILTPSQEEALDELIARLTDSFQKNQIGDVATSSVMELYGYKMSCMEQRLHSYSVGMQGATEHMASLQHTVALLQATNTSQQDVLYTVQMQNEKYKEGINTMSSQLADAEQSLKAYRAKLASERLDKEQLVASTNQKHQQQLLTLEMELKSREKAIAEKDQAIQRLTELRDSLQDKLEQQSLKNSELAGVLVKFEERVKQRDKRLEEAGAQHLALKREQDQASQMIKQLEKTLLERDNRLSQLTLQLEEMQRVQEMVAKLMAGNKSLQKAT